MMVFDHEGQQYNKNITTDDGFISQDNASHNAKSHADRKFYDISQAYQLRDSIPVGGKCADLEELLGYIYQNIIGNTAEFSAPFGHRNVTYCDYTASGRALRFIEDFIQNHVLPWYGNTHTTTSVTSLQCTLFRHEARDIIRNYVNASEHDAVLFVGTGCTGAVHKLISALNLTTEDPPIVFVSPYEHHSNLLPWRELGSQMITIKELADGTLDLEYLEVELKKHQGKGKKMIGTFSAASNITGILTDDRTVTAILHKYGALAFWDYACAGPYVDIDMNPLSTGADHGLVYKDAIFISPHKFIGGPDTPGILVAKKNLFVNAVPSGGGGGGSVFFVRRENHRYLQEIEMREESGTPSIVGAIRAGMVFQLKDALTPQLIQLKDQQLCQKAFSAWKDINELVMLGSTEVARLPIFSFVVRHPASATFLHHNYVCVLLNDLFGIQARGGCACAGPYAQDLLGIDENLATYFEDLLAEDRTLDRIHLRRYREYSDREILRPGFVRINLPYFMPEEEVDFVVEAVRMVAEEGWKLLPQYLFNPETGEWKHRNHQVFKDRKWLGGISYASGKFAYGHSIKDTQTGPASINKKDYLERAREVFATAEKVASRTPLPQHDLMFDEQSEKVRWFLLPNEARSYLLGENFGNQKKKNIPFVPKVYPKRTLQVCRNNIGLQQSHGIWDTHLDPKIQCIDDQLSDLVYQQKLPSDLAISNGTASDFVEHRACECDNRANNHLPVKENFMQNLSERTSNATNENAKWCSRRSKDKESKEHQGVQAEGRCHWHPPSKNIFKPFLQGVHEFDMIQDGDRLLVCLSGGKDSLSLLHTVRQYQFYARKRNVNFEFGAVTVDPGSAAYDPSPLKNYLEALKVPYFYEEQGIINQAAALPECTSICSFCSRMKRGRIYACARREHYNVLALGQHLDDLAESFMMSLFHNGLLRTMKANYFVREGDLRVIRPFVYVREKNLRKFAEEKKLPVIAENCPACFEAPKERHRIKQLLAAQEILFPQLFYSLRCAMYPLMAIDRCGLEGKHQLLLNGRLNQLNNTASDDEAEFGS